MVQASDCQTQDYEPQQSISRCLQPSLDANLLTGVCTN
eukprot:Gb_15804 [translate_table: standard]